MDLLVYAQELAKKGNTQAAAYLQTINQASSPSPIDSKPKNNAPLLIGGLAVAVILAVAIGYLWGKKKKSQELEE